MDLDYRSIIDFGISETLEVLNLGFSDYLVHVQIDTPGLYNMLRFDGIDLGSSWVVLQDGRGVGAALVARRGWSSRIAGMAVVPQARRQGLGKALMGQLLSEARKRDEQRVELEVITENEPAVALYEGLGFQVMRRLKSYRCDQPVENTAPLERIDLAEMARLLNCFGPPDLPWQISGWSLAQLGTPYQAYQLEEACAAISSPEESRINLRSLLIPPGDPGQGVRLLRALFARFEDKTWHVPAIFPEEFSQIFRQAGFEPGQLSQLQMELFIAQ